MRKRGIIQQRPIENNKKKSEIYTQTDQYENESMENRENSTHIRNKIPIN